MNKTVYTLILGVVFFCATAQKKPEFGMTLSTYSGTAVLEQKGQVDLNGFVRYGAEVMARLVWAEQWGVFAGIGTHAFYANKTLSGETMSIASNYMVVPFGVSYGIPLFKSEEQKTAPLWLQIDVGAHVGNLRKHEEDSMDYSSTQSNLGWNFGINGKLGMVYQFYNKFNFGLGLAAKRDLTDIKDQKITQSNALFASLGCRFL